MKETTETQPKKKVKLFEVKIDFCYLTGRHYNKAEWCRTSTKIQPLIFKTGKR